MTNSNLNCIVSDCTYNNCGYCYASFIKITGFDAISPSGTNCNTYKEKTNETSSLKLSITCSQNIICDAKNCTYNYFGGCNAPNVFISTQDNICDTFKIKH